MAIVYARNSDNSFQLVNWILGSLEILLLFLALNYQRKFRYQGNNHIVFFKNSRSIFNIINRI